MGPKLWCLFLYKQGKHLEIPKKVFLIQYFLLLFHFYFLHVPLFTAKALIFKPLFELRQTEINL